MALIKQRRQFLPQSIGVVRPDTGAEFVARGAERLANSMIESSFDQLKREARKAGVETAQAASAASLRTINPETGRPEAFKVPGNFGIAAQQAYEETIEKRYINQTESDIKLKAQEIALKFQNDPDGAAKFGTELGDYIDALSANAAPKFANIVNNVGSVVLASGKLNLQGKQLERQRADLASSAGANIDRAIEGYSDVLAIGATEEDLELALSVVNRSIEIAANGFPEVFTPEAVEKIRSDLRNQEVGGLASRLVAQATTIPNINSDIVNNIETALLAPNNEAMLEAVPESLRSLVTQITGSDGFATNRQQIIRQLDGLRTNLQIGEVNADRAASLKERELIEENSRKAIAFAEGITNEESKTSNLVIDAIVAGRLGDVAGLISSYDSKLDDQIPTFNAGNRSTAPLEASKRAIRKLAIVSIMSEASRTATHDELQDLDIFLRTGGAAGGDNLPDRVKDMGRTILGIANAAEDFTQIRAESDRALRETKPSTPTAAQVALTNLTNGHLLDGADKTNREAADEFVFISSNVPEDQRQPGWFLTNSAFDEFTNDATGVTTRIPTVGIGAMMQRRVIPEGLGDSLGAVASGFPLEEGAYENALEMYRYFYRVPTQEGTFLSLWSGPGGLEPKESAVFQTVLALQRLDPSRDVRQTFMQVIERQQNEKEVERNIIFGLQGFKKGSDFKSADGKLNAYLNEVAGGNRLARELFEPQIIAMASSGFNFAAIDKAIKEYKERVFAPTNGMVVDRLSGFSGTSPYALGAQFPDDEIRNIFISKVQSVLNEKTQGSSGTYVFSRAAAENPGKFGLDNANIVKLVPFPNLSLKPNEKNQLVYMAMYVNKSNELVPVEGNDGPIFIPLSSANEEIDNLLQKRTREQLEAGAASEEEKKRREEQGKLSREKLPSMPDDGA